MLNAGDPRNNKKNPFVPWSVSYLVCRREESECGWLDLGEQSSVSPTYASAVALRKGASISPPPPKTISGQCSQLSRDRTPILAWKRGKAVRECKVAKGRCRKQRGCNLVRSLSMFLEPNWSRAWLPMHDLITAIFLLFQLYLAWPTESSFMRLCLLFLPLHLHSENRIKGSVFLTSRGMSLEIWQVSYDTLHARLW